MKWLILSLLLSAQAFCSDLSLSRLAQTVVRVEAGSGSIVQAPSGKKYILTNSHVCMVVKWKGTIKATDKDGMVLIGKIVKDDLKSDLCAAEVTTAIKGLTLGAKLEEGQAICTRGYPLGILSVSCGKSREYNTWGYVFPIEVIGECPKDTTKYRDPYTGRLVGCYKETTSILTSLYSRPGSSGSAVVDEQGNIVGAISDWHPKNDYEAGMVPYPLLKTFLSTL